MILKIKLWLNLKLWNDVGNNFDINAEKLVYSSTYVQLYPTNHFMVAFIIKSHNISHTQTMHLQCMAMVLHCMPALGLCTIL